MRRKVRAHHRPVHLGGDPRLIGIALIDAKQDVFDVFLDRRRGDAMQRIIGDLLVTAAVGFAKRAFHRTSDPVGVHDHAAFFVSRSAADGLHK